MDTLRNARRLTTLLTVLGLLACATEGRPPGYDDAAFTAQRNATNPRYARYNHHIRRDFVGQILRMLRECRLESLDTTHATFLYRLDSSGKTLETMVYPPSAFSECVHPRLSELEFPPPPKPDYWLGFFVPDCPLGGGLVECSQLSP